MNVDQMVEREASLRLDMLHSQLTWARETLIISTQHEDINADCEWDAVCAALEDTISDILNAIEGIDDWARERHNDIRADRADHARDARLTGG